MLVNSFNWTHLLNATRYSKFDVVLHRHLAKHDSFSHTLSHTTPTIHTFLFARHVWTFTFNHTMLSHNMLVVLLRIYATCINGLLMFVFRGCIVAVLFGGGFWSAHTDHEGCINDRVLGGCQQDCVSAPSPMAVLRSLSRVWLQSSDGIWYIRGDMADNEYQGCELGWLRRSWQKCTYRPWGVYQTRV